MKKTIKIILITLLSLFVFFTIVVLFIRFIKTPSVDFSRADEPNFITLTITADELDSIALITSMDMPDSIRRNLEDYDYLVSFVEMNYAPFSAIMEKGHEQEYRTMKKQLRQQVIQGEADIEKAAIDYTLWFFSRFDRHIGVKTEAFSMARNTFFPQDIEIIEYAPKAVSCKVDSCTWLIRVPSCEPNFEEQTNNAFQQFVESDCKNLIVDVRGNRGGGDSVWRKYFAALYDHPSKSNIYWFRNTPENLHYWEDALEMYPTNEYYQWIIENCKTSKENFVKLSERNGNMGLHPTARIHRAAVLIDWNTASAAESLVGFVKKYSDRAKVYGKGNTFGANQSGNINFWTLPNSKIEFYYATTIDSELYENEFSGTPGIAPDIIIPLPYATTLTDNIDEWVLWVAEDLKR